METLAMPSPPGFPVRDGLKESMPGLPGRMRFADLNSDGYPDAVLTYQFSSEDGKSTTTGTAVWQNTESNATAAESSRELTSGTEPDSYYKKISSEAGTTAELVTFMDIDEDGRLDIIIQKLDANGLPQLQVLYNNIN